MFPAETFEFSSFYQIKIYLTQKNCFLRSTIHQTVISTCRSLVYKIKIFLTFRNTPRNFSSGILRWSSNRRSGLEKVTGFRCHLLSLAVSRTPELSLQSFWNFPPHYFFVIGLTAYLADYPIDVALDDYGSRPALSSPWTEGLASPFWPCTLHAHIKRPRGTMIPLVSLQLCISLQIWTTSVK